MLFDGYSGLPSDGSAILNVGEANLRMVRGGSWRDPAEEVRTAARFCGTASGRNKFSGFRVLARPR